MGDYTGARIWVSCIAATLLVSGCSSTNDGDAQCTQTSDCRAGWNCVGEVCRQACNNTADCDEVGYRCDFGVCLPASANECDDASDCTKPNACQLRDGAACTGGECIYAPIPCDTPPDDLCIDGGNTLRAHGHTGTCVLGVGGCEYPTFDTPCPSCTSSCLPTCAALDCADWECVTNGHCDPATSACAHDQLPNDTSCVQGTGLAGTCFDGVCLPPGETSCLSNPPCPETCLGGWCRSHSPPGWPCDPGDDADCQADLTCVDSRCRSANGATCTSNDSCLETCIAGLCAPRSTATGSCDRDDNDDCVAGLSCASGFCYVASGGDCTFNSDCAGTCIDLICSPVSAIDGPCDTDDDDDCSGNAGCFDSVCLLGDGVSCATNDECVGTCIDGTCAPLATPETRCDDPADCDIAMGDATCQAGVCRLLDGGTCTGNSECLNTCIAGSCAPLSELLEPCEEPDDCGAGLECVVDSCRQPLGVACSDDNECGSGHCECTTSSCSPRVCAAADCDCRYGAGGSCATNLPTGSDDPQDCEGTLSCQSGTCVSDNPGSCTCVCGTTQTNCAPPHVGANNCGVGWNPTCSADGCLWFCYSGCGCLALTDPAPSCSCN